MRRQFDELKGRVREEKRKRQDDVLEPYLKNYNDTVAMDEIVQIERKEKKKEEKKESRE